MQRECISHNILVILHQQTWPTLSPKKKSSHSVLIFSMYRVQPLSCGYQHVKVHVSVKAGNQNKYGCQEITILHHLKIHLSGIYLSSLCHFMYFLVIVTDSLLSCSFSHILVIFYLSCHSPVTESCGMTETSLCLGYYGQLIDGALKLISCKICPHILNYCISFNCVQLILVDLIESSTFSY